MSCLRRDKRVIVERGEAKTHLHMLGESSRGIQADNASINVFLGELKPPPTSSILHKIVKLKL